MAGQEPLSRMCAKPLDRVSVGGRRGVRAGSGETAVAASDAEMMVPPTRERLRHGLVERFDRQIADADGAIGVPFRSLDWLALMARRGTLSADMREAGERYAGEFRLSQLDPLRAASLDRARTPPGQRRPDDLGARAIGARRRLEHAQAALGGVGSPCERGAWHVLGFGRTIAEWCRAEGGWLREESAKGVLVGALGVLARHYGLASGEGAVNRAPSARRERKG